MPNTYIAARAQAGVPARAQEKGTYGEVSGFTLTANIVTDVVNMVKVPPGATVNGITLANAALGASTTVSVGDGASATYWLAATSTSSAGRQRTTALAKKYPNGDTLFITVGGATASGVVQLLADMTMETTVVA